MLDRMSDTLPMLLAGVLLPFALVLFSHGLPRGFTLTRRHLRRAAVSVGVLALTLLALSATRAYEPCLDVVFMPSDITCPAYASATATEIAFAALFLLYCVSCLLATYFLAAGTIRFVCERPAASPRGAPFVPASVRAFVG